jgi:copper chaperone
MKYEFRTNINCGGCIEKITPYLNGNQKISKWNVDTANPSKILTIETDSLSERDICEIVRQGGFTAKSLNAE